MVNFHVCDVWLELGARTILFGEAVRSSEATHEGAVHIRGGGGFARIVSQKKFRCPILNSFCTHRAQDFNTLGRIQ